MVVAPIPSRESARLDALHRRHILDTPSEPAFDELARLAAYVCRTPIAVISFVDSTRQWFKSVVGLPYTESPRAMALCAHTILGIDLFIVEEADADERFNDHPWVVESPSIRFYAGVPLITSDGHAIGSLAVLDVVPRTLTPEQRTGMHTLATQVMAQLELRERARAAACSPDHVEGVIRLVSSGIAQHSGKKFFESLVEVLRYSTEADYALCARLSADGNRVQTVSVWGPDGNLQNFEYDLRGTPCENVVGKTFCHYPAKVQAQFPADSLLEQMAIESYMGLPLFGAAGQPVGLIAVLSTRSMACPDRAEAILRVCGGRAGSELERLSSEEARRRGEDLFRQVIDNTTAVIYVKDLSGRYLVINRRYEELFQVSNAHICGKTDYELFPQAAADVFRANDLTVAESGTVHEFEEVVPQADGPHTYWSIKFPLTNPDGVPYATCGISTDLTERKQAAERLKTTEEKLRQALPASNTGLWDWNTETGDVSYSKEWKSQIGYGETELPDSFETWVSRLHPDDRDQAILCAQRYRDNPVGAFRQDFRLRHKDGSYRWIDSHASFVTEPDGRRIRLLGSHTDITERKQTEEALRKSEERFRAAYRNATIGMSTADLNGRIQEVNHALCAILGYSEQELRTRTFQSLTHPDDLGENLERVHRLLAGDMPSDVIEKRYVRKDGGIVWAQVGLSVIRDAAGNPVHMLAMIQDITERKRAEEAVQLAKFTVDRATEAIYWVGSGAELLDVNEAACAMLGYSKEEFRRMTVHDINPSFQPDSWPAYWEETRQRGAVSFESVHQAKDGRLIPIEVNVNFLSYRGRECHCAFVRNITERKRAEHVLRVSEERFNYAIEATNEGVWDWDIATGTVYFSPQWIRLLGYRPEEVVHSADFFFSLLHPEDVARTTAVLQEHLEGHTPLKELEVRLRQNSGEYRWYLDRGKVVARSQDGRPVRMVGTIADITERRRAEEERASALNNLQTIMETVPDVIFALDLEGRLNKWNLRMEVVTGYTPSELSDKPALEMVPFEEAERTAAAIREAVETGYAELEGHLLTKNGRTIPYHWTGAPFTDLQGRVIGITGVGRDMTERKKAERMLAAEKQILEMIGADALLSDVLEALCLMIEGLSDGALCSVLLLDDEGRHLHHGAAPSLPEAYTRAINGMTIGPMRGSCGTAAFTGRQVIVEDIGHDPLWADFRSLALPHGLRACWSTPIMSAAGKVLGTFAVYYRTARYPAGELSIVDRASHLACLAIERARAQAALRLTRFSIERAVDAVLWVDAHARILDVNDAACTTLGYSREELLSKTVHDIDRSFPAEAWPAHWEELKARKSFSFETDHQRKDGTVIQTEMTVNYLIHEGHEYNCAFMRDITDRKRAEAALRMTRFSVERVSDAVFWIDADARILDVNEAACLSLQYSREELLSLRLFAIAPHVTPDKWSRLWREKLEHRSMTFESSHLRKDGSSFPVEVTCNHLQFGGQEFCCAIQRDITERKDVEGRLKFSEERFRLVAEAANDILWDWDLVTHAHWWSPNAREKFGYDSSKEPSITAWTNRLHPDDRARVLATVDRALASEARMVTAEYRFRLVDGSYGHFYDRGQIVRDASGRPIRMTGAMIDVTLSKRAYASLEVAYQRLQSMSRELQAVESNERRRLSRELHDEVGQLLTGLKFDLQATRQALGDPNEATFARARERTLRALETTDELFARLRHVVRALRPPVLEELGLKAALEAMVSDVQSRSDLACSVSIEADGLVALTDTTIETGLYRMAQELATNVVRHGQAMTMSVILAMDSRHWILTVQDDGVGFDPNTEPISGMGLRGVRERAEILGGHVDISSIPGAGSTVTVWIPVAGPALENA